MPQAISDALLEILASKHQAGTRGYGGRIEIDYLIPGATTVGETVDLAALYGTVTNDPANTLDWANPTNVNDGNHLTEASVEFHFGGTFRLICDLGSAGIVSEAWVRTAYAMTLEYSTDGISYSPLTGVTWTFTSHHATPNWYRVTWSGGDITAQYWRLGRTSAGVGAHEGIATWELIGAATEVVDDSLGTTSYQVEAISIDKTRRLTAAQLEAELAIGNDSSVFLAPSSFIVTNARIRAYQWYGSVENEVLVFTGSIDEIREGRDPRTLRIVARDMVKRLIVQTFGAIAPQGADEDGADRTEANGVYIGRDVDYIVNDILDRAGVPEDKRSVAATGYGLDEYVLSDGASWAECIIGDDRLTGLTGYDLWADEQGVIHFESVLASKAADSDTDPTPDYSYIVAA